MEILESLDGEPEGESGEGTRGDQCGMWGYKGPCELFRQTWRRLKSEVWPGNKKLQQSSAMSSTWLKFKLCQRFTE
jgi:hypothetical protein